MWDMATKLVMFRKLNLEKGKISFLRIYCCIIPIPTLIYIQKDLEKRGVVASLYFGAKKTGVEWNENMKQSFGAKSAIEIFEWGNRVLNTAGWGELKFERADFKKNEFVWTMEESQTANLYGSSKKAVCHIVRGFFAGAASFVTKKDLDAIEIFCKAKGDKQCRFVIRDREKLEKEYPSLREQLRT